jgi:hypothetical protein
MALAAVATAGLVLLGSPAHAADVSAVVTALHQSRVYVAPGTTIKANESASIMDRLNSHDGLYVAIFPAGIDKPDALSAGISQALGGKNVVMVVVGNDSAMTSTLLPLADATVALSNAQSVSSNPVDTAITFVDNVHDYQTKHPEAIVKTMPKATPKGGTKGSGSSNPRTIWGVACIWLIVLVIVWGTSSTIKRRRRRPVRLPDPPGKIPSLVGGIRRQLSGIDDVRVSTGLEKALVNLSQLFIRLKKNVDEHQITLATNAYVDRLETLARVVDRYTDVQNTRELGYYRNPDMAMQHGREAFQGFADHVLTAIQDANEGKLTEFEVDTRLLRTTRT